MTTAPLMAGEHYWIGTSREFELGVEITMQGKDGHKEGICPVSVAGHDVFLHAFPGHLKFWLVDETWIKNRTGRWNALKRLVR